MKDKIDIDDFVYCMTNMLEQILKRDGKLEKFYPIAIVRGYGDACLFNEQPTHLTGERFGCKERPITFSNGDVLYLNTAFNNKNKIDMVKRFAKKYNVSIPSLDFDELDDENDIEIDVLEKTIESYIEHHLDKIEKGLKLYEKDGKIGRQFYITPTKRIDLLGVRLDDGFHVIEIKRGTVDAKKLVSQILEYMGLVNKYLASGSLVWGTIVIDSVDEELAILVNGVANLNIVVYDNLKVTMDLKLYEEENEQSD